MKIDNFHIGLRTGKFAPAFLLLAGLLWSISFVYGNNDAVRFSENVNLALRRTAHLLLAENGDTTSMIPPVVQPDGSTFSIRLQSVLQYDQLPYILKESLEQQHISRGYNVSIRNCETGDVQLGYNFQDVTRKNGVPCMTREQDLRCYELTVTFLPEKTAAAGGNTSWWLVTLGGAVAALGFIAWKRNSRKPQTATTAPDHRQHFGQSTFDAANQLLTVAGNIHQLTFREAKLLGLFIAHPNKVLERDFILKSIWEDEGVTVGRSVDVFVSRLRKMLSYDPALKITAVHGVGYRFEVQS